MDQWRYPYLDQINTRVWLTELFRVLGRRATLDDIPDAELDRLAGLGASYQTGWTGLVAPLLDILGRAYFISIPSRPNSCIKCLYKYPQAAYPYADLVETESGNIDDEFSANRIGIVVLSMLVAGPRLNRRIKYRHRPNAIIG
jgi:hypothetical protein